jgi:thiosulfate/3-mercaptopyruvate sulfurtransferase
VLLDVRTEQEYRGDNKPRSGHVPGARFWPWEQALDTSRGFSRAAGGLIEASLKQAGAAAKDAPIIAYCRSGHRAAHSYWALRSLGFENVKLYANSMNEYLADPGAPLTRGTEP